MIDYRIKLLEMIDEGLLDPKDAIEMCARWMTSDDIFDMLDANEIHLEDTEE